jgi:LCP family protein required for cell wall assembly
MFKTPAKAVALALALFAVVGFVRGASRKEDKTDIFAEIPEKQNFLLLGKDNASGLYDVIMLASVDTEQKRAVVFQIPRDTYVNLGEKSYKKINGAAAILGTEGKLCDLLEGALGIEVNGYVAFDTRFVKETVDGIGGVELNVPFDMDYEDPYQNLSIHLKKGKQVLGGEEAVGFVRYRNGYLRADVGRLDAQKIFLAALSKKLLETHDARLLLELAKNTLKYVKTDLPITALTSAGMALKGALGENIELVTMPGEEVQSSVSGAWFYILSKEGCGNLLSAYGADGIFDPDEIFTDGSREEFDEIYRRNIESKVYNAATIDGEGINIITKKRN